MRQRYRVWTNRVNRSIQADPVRWMAVAVLILFVMYSLIPETWRELTDLALTSALMLAFVWTAKLQYQRTTIWTLRGLGFFGTIVGDAFLYGTLGIGAFLGWQFHMLNLTRACLTVGVTLLIIGLKRTQADPVIDGGISFTSMAMTLAMVTADDRGTILFTTPKFDALVGAREDELFGQNLTVLMPESWRDQHRRGFNRFLQTGIPTLIDRIVSVELLRRSGEVMPVSLALTADQQGGRWYFTGAVWTRDDERKKPDHD